MIKCVVGEAGKVGWLGLLREVGWCLGSDVLRIGGIVVIKTIRLLRKTGQYFLIIRLRFFIVFVVGFSVLF